MSHVFIDVFCKCWTNECNTKLKL